MYPFGYSIETEPNEGIRVEMRADALGVRVYTEKEELDGQTVRVVIRQNRDCLSGGKRVFYWNGKVILNEEEKKKSGLIEQKVLNDDTVVVVKQHKGKKNKKILLFYLH